MKFNELKLIDPILRAVQAEGYETATPIQVQSIPLILARKDLLACAQTGTGKTAAFALPILQILTETAPRVAGVRDIRVLVLTPTRELASQIAQNFTDYGKQLPLRNTVIFGGVNQKSQVKALRNGTDILIATPGRLLDLMQQKQVQFNSLEILVLDEADRMLDMGFIHDVKRIIAKIPRSRQTLFFSATMPPDIRKLSEQILVSPVRVEVTPVSSTAEKIQQGIYYVEKKKKTSLLIQILSDVSIQCALVFTRTKRDANRVSESLNGAGIRAEAIHGNKSQNARERALEQIKKGQCRVLVATDIAARGIDIDQVTHVFNHDIPNVSESYVHRIGRTARAGRAGSAYSFCSGEERAYLADIERLIRKKIEVISTPENLSDEGKAKNRSPMQGQRPQSGQRQRPSRDSQRTFGQGQKSQRSFDQVQRSTDYAPRATGQIQVPSGQIVRPTGQIQRSFGPGQKQNRPVAMNGAQVQSAGIKMGGSRPSNPPPAANNRRQRREQARLNSGLPQN